MHHFSRIEYDLSNQLIEFLSYAGQATTMIGLLKYADHFSKAHGLNPLRHKHTATTAAKADNIRFAAWHAYLIQSPTVKGTFSFRILLMHIFGFLWGLWHNCIRFEAQPKSCEEKRWRCNFRAAIAHAGNVSLDKTSWSHITLFQQKLKSFIFTSISNQKFCHQ